MTTGAPEGITYIAQGDQGPVVCFASSEQADDGRHVPIAFAPSTPERHKTIAERMATLSGRNGMTIENVGKLFELAADPSLELTEALAAYDGNGEPLFSSSELMKRFEAAGASLEKRWKAEDPMRKYRRWPVRISGDVDLDADRSANLLWYRSPRLFREAGSDPLFSNGSLDIKRAAPDGGEKQLFVMGRVIKDDEALPDISYFGAKVSGDAQVHTVEEGSVALAKLHIALGETEQALANLKRPIRWKLAGTNYDR
ncbi:MAG TPA: hypothetical protein VIJ68_00025 [Candidatus Saccharimonadales bacterium]